MGPLTLHPAIDAMPLVAILRGVPSDEVLSLARVLIETGLTCLEVPLNASNAYDSIEQLIHAYRDQHSILVGAGTVIDKEAVGIVAKLGVKLLIMPHCDTVIIREAKRQDLICMPGVATPTEAYQAIQAGADALKIFPAEKMITPDGLKAMKAILPPDMPLFPVGGITTNNMLDYWRCGASGFGLGSALYRAGDGPRVLRQRAEAFVMLMHRLHKK